MRSQPVRVALDLETTGLHPEHDAIIEIGAVKFAGDEVLDTFEALVAPAIPLPYRIQRLTGIAPAKLRGAPPLVTVLPRLREFLGDLPLVGHNIPFDVAFLRRVG
ncbi:MAG TPA: 3'-5' exonuclease, partial [Ktedonobacterales bacterium]